MRREIVKTLNNIATLLELKGENSFKIRAYKTGSEIIENFSGDIEQIAKDEKLDEIKGIGKALASKIQEIINTGRLSYYENLKSEFLDSIFELFDVSNLGPKKIKYLYDTLKVDSIEKLESSISFIFNPSFEKPSLIKLNIELFSRSVFLIILI